MNSKTLIGAAMGLVQHHCPNILVENGGSVKFTRSFSASVLKRMSMVKRCATKAAKKECDLEYV